MSTKTPNNINKQIDKKLHSIFGFTSFRLGQREIVNAVLNNRDLFAVMPTGGGKSLCYQLPAAILTGTAIVISPLISLMKDQVDGANANGISSAYINSTLSNIDRDKIENKMLKGEFDLLYIAPERFAQAGFIDMLNRCKISFFAIDEAHCISEWGHDFRPDYLLLSNIIKLFPGLAVIAFTATATQQVQDDIISRLKLRLPYIHRASFDRPNLFIEVKPKKNIDNQIVEFIKTHPNESGIIYRTTRKSVEETAMSLTLEGISAKPYHAGLPDNIRHENQDAFNRDEISVIVATVAFGMGIDKSNVRFVIHGDLPKNMEGYYQEIGRAGRDGESAHCTLFFGRGDIPKQRYFINQVEDEKERNRLLSILNMMASYAGVYSCRRKGILSYFDEEYQLDNCKNCDVCTGTVKKSNVTIEAQKILSTIIRTGNRFGSVYIIDVLIGANKAKIRERGHEKLSCYGVGNDHDIQFWFAMIDTLIASDIIVRTKDQYPVLQCSTISKPILSGEKKVYMIIPEATNVSRRKKWSRGVGCTNVELFNNLRALRFRLAKKQGVPPYVVFSDATLREMSDLLPKCNTTLLDINGVGDTKLKKYGAIFLEAITDWHKQNPIAKSAEITAPMPRKIRSKNIKGETYKITHNLFNEGLSIKNIAEKRELAISTIEGHIFKLLEDGENIDIDRIITPDEIRLIENLFDSIKKASIKDIVEAGRGKISYAQVRIVQYSIGQKL